MKRNNKGFTVLEVTIAMAVLTLTTGMILGGLTRITMANVDVQARTHAVGYLGMVVTEVKKLRPEEVSDFVPVLPKNGYNAVAEVLLLDENGDEIIDGAAANPVQTKVSIKLQVAGSRAVEISTLVYLRTDQ